MHGWQSLFLFKLHRGAGGTLSPTSQGERSLNFHCKFTWDSTHYRHSLLPSALVAEPEGGEEHCLNLEPKQLHRTAAEEMLQEYSYIREVFVGYETLVQQFAVLAERDKNL